MKEIIFCGNLDWNALSIFWEGQAIWVMAFFRGLKGWFSDFFHYFEKYYFFDKNSVIHENISYKILHKKAYYTFFRTINCFWVITAEWYNICSFEQMRIYSFSHYRRYRVLSAVSSLGLIHIWHSKITLCIKHSFSFTRSSSVSTVLCDIIKVPLN